MKVYVASSWRNEQRQQAMVRLLRAAGCEVYDFRKDDDGQAGFTAWELLGEGDHREWDTTRFRDILTTNEQARRFFKRDMDALTGADACVLVLPCGKSAHLEMGWAAGAGRRSVVLLEPGTQPELMYLMADAVCVTAAEVLTALGLNVHAPNLPAADIQTLTPPWPQQAERTVETLHLFKESTGGDTYAARDIAHAKELWKADTGMDPDDGNDWQPIPDDRSVTVDVDGTKVTKTAAQWAAEMTAPGCCFGENY